MDERRGGGGQVGRDNGEWRLMNDILKKEKIESHTFGDEDFRVS